MIFVDTNVLIDVLGPPSPTAEWSRSALAQAYARDALVIGPIVYAEVAGRFAEQAAVDTTLALLEITLAPELSRDVLFLAAKAHLRYRENGGARMQILPDFLIGAHAAHANAPLLTRDARRFRAYFPTLALIAPEPSEPPAP